MRLLKTAQDNAGTIATAFQIGQRFFGPGNIDELNRATLVAINLWCLANTDIKAEAFPDLNAGDRVLSDQFQISGWGRVWFQRAFWLLHRDSGIESRWIDGRLEPQDVVTID